MAYGRQPAGWFTGFMGGASRLFGRGMRGGKKVPRHRLGEASGYPKGQKPSWAMSDTPPPLSAIPGFKPKSGWGKKAAIAGGAAAAGGAAYMGYKAMRGSGGGGGGQGYGQGRYVLNRENNPWQQDYDSLSNMVVGDSISGSSRPGVRKKPMAPVQKDDGSGTGPSAAGKKPMAPVGPKKRSGKGKMKAPARKGGGRGGMKAPARSGGGGMRKTSSQPKSWWGSMSRGRQNTLIAGAGFAGGFLAGRLSKRRAKGGTVYSGSYVRNYYY